MDDYHCADTIFNVIHKKAPVIHRGVYRLWKKSQGVLMKKISIICAALIGASLLSACVPVLMGTAVGTTVATTTDRRTYGSQMSDAVMEKKVALEIGNVIKEGIHLTVTSYNGTVLLTGEVRTQANKDLAEKVARETIEVKRVRNFLAVMEPVGVSQRLKDSALATRVRTSIIGDSRLSLNQLKVVVDRGNTYLMGMVTQKEAQALLDVVRRVSGVKMVYPFYDVLSEEELKERLSYLEPNMGEGQNMREGSSGEVVIK